MLHRIRANKQPSPVSTIVLNGKRPMNTIDVGEFEIIALCNYNSIGFANSNRIRCLYTCDILTYSIADASKRGIVNCLCQSGLRSSITAVTLRLYDAREVLKRQIRTSLSRSWLIYLVHKNLQVRSLKVK